MSGVMETLSAKGAKQNLVIVFIQFLHKNHTVSYAKL